MRVKELRQKVAKRLLVKAKSVTKRLEEAQKPREVGKIREPVLVIRDLRKKKKTREPKKTKRGTKNKETSTSHRRFERRRRNKRVNTSGNLVVVLI